MIIKNIKSGAPKIIIWIQFLPREACVFRNKIYEVYGLTQDHEVLYLLNWPIMLRKFQPERERQILLVRTAGLYFFATKLPLERVHTPLNTPVADNYF